MMDTSLSASSPLQNEPRYQEVLNFLQSSDWDDASKLLDELASDYPNLSEIKSLQEYAQLKASMEKRRPTLNIQAPSAIREFLSGRRGLILLLVVVLVAIFVFFRGIIQPRAEAQAAADRLNQHMTDARSAMTSLDFVKAQNEFEAILEQDPTNEAAKTGVAEARAAGDLDARYVRAEELQKDQKWSESLAILQEIVATNPNYRDVNTLIQNASRATSVSQQFQKAEDSFKKQEWQAAIEGYEAVRSIDLSYQRDGVTNNLFESYLRQAESLINKAESPGDAEIALSMLQQALSLKPRETAATSARDQVQIYLTGQNLFDRGDWRGVVAVWQPLYDQSPSFFNGNLAKSLYQAYLEEGAGYQRDRDYVGAYRSYDLASQLDVSDKSEARQRVGAVAILLTPTPTPEPTATATPPPTPIVEGPPPTPVPPTLLSSPKLKGMIVFRSNRSGDTGLYAMRPDGKGLVVVEDDQAKFEVVGTSGDKLLGGTAYAGFDSLYARDAFTPDGRLRVFVQGSKNSPAMGIYLWHYDIPQTWDNVRTQVLDNSAVNYDPVISSDGNLIIYVSQKDGDDEIWRVNADGSNPRALTKNDWEWDKHPSLSPDGKSIVFWSNRGKTGNGQLYMMDLEGNNLRNISNNEYYEWDPIWVK